MKTSRIRTILSLIWLIFTMSLITWWFIFILKNNASNLEAHSEKNFRMFILEGSTLLLTVLIGGLVMVFLSHKDDQRNAKLKFFFSNFTHDIKTSITRVRLQSDLLKEEDSFSKNKTLQRLLNDISKLDLQLENALFLTYVDNPSLLKEKIDLAEMLESIQFEYEDLKINCSKSALISGDSKAFSSIIRNLLENSRRHGKATAVEVNLSQENKDIVKIEIKDNGLGCDLNSMKLGQKILSSGHNKGSGIGLYLVKQLLLSMNGSIQFTIAQDKGFVANIFIKGQII